MSIKDELDVIYDLRCALLDLYSDTDDSEKYILANELLNDLEKLVRERNEEEDSEDE